MVKKRTRRQERIASPPLAVRIAWEDKYAIGRLLDQSQSGVLLALQHPLAVRSILTLQNDQMRLNRSGSVRYCARQGNKYLIGVEFSGLA